MVKYNDEKREMNVILTDQYTRDFAVTHENIIYTCSINGIEVYNMKGEIIKTIPVQCPKDIAVLNDNIIINTEDGRIIIYEFEYC